MRSVVGTWQARLLAPESTRNARAPVCCIEHAVTDATAYAWHVNTQRSTAAQDTAGILQQAALDGVPVMIPGAFETRAAHPPARAPDVIAIPVTAHARDTDVYDRGRLEREREGGGAPSERTAGRFRSMVTRLRRWV